MTDPTHERWYVLVDDLVGGHAIANVDKKRVSELDWSKGERTYVDLILTEELAHYIVGLHNYLHKSRFPEKWKES